MLSMRYLAVISLTAMVFLAGCSGKEVKKEAKIFAAGEKAQVADLSYVVIDTQFATTLGGNDPATQRTPKDRFVMVQVAVSNGGSNESNIPGMTLIDDAGQVYPELADGTGVTKWLGMVRKVGPTETEQGIVLFDAPAKHFRLRLTDDIEDDISIDVPLSYVHEQMRDMGNVAPTESAPITIPPKR